MSERWTGMGWVMAGLVLALAGGVEAREIGGKALTTGASCIVPSGEAGVASPVRLGMTAAPVRRAAAQVTRNERADVTFEIRPAAAGGVEVHAQRGTLSVKKTVQPTGDFVLELNDAQDTTTVAVSGQGIRVARGRTSITLPRGSADEVSGVRVRRLLAESGAVLQFRATAAVLLAQGDLSPAALAMLIADAVVGGLAGDVDAPRRLAQHLGTRGRGQLRPAGMALDCYTVMEQRMTEAWNDFGQCYYSTSYNSFYQSLCSWRWTLQVESYWFSFISCSGFNDM